MRLPESVQETVTSAVVRRKTGHQIPAAAAKKGGSRLKPTKKKTHLTAARRNPLTKMPLSPAAAHVEAGNLPTCQPAVHQNYCPTIIQNGLVSPT
jgi:hypothetical protein